MSTFQNKFLNQDQRTLIRNFLPDIFNNECYTADSDGVVSHLLDQRLVCHGFPDFNPQSRSEFIGFANYLNDAFDQMNVDTKPALSIGCRELIRIKITGKHHETFMGLTPSGGQLSMTAILLLKIQHGLIKEMTLYAKKVKLTTPDGNIYQSIKSKNAGARKTGTGNE